jgi:topoisomerase-4 subunit A
MIALPVDDLIQPIAFKDALSERYLAYALSTIMSRSLPDVRDGMKPVHRRLLFAMRELKLNPDTGFKKCARVVGDVIGKFHPHGDSAVYETLVRLAQEFSLRYPLIEGQGNFGSIDGDNAAAMRYTEARLTDVAMALMADLDMDTVDFRPTYDGSEHEPVVFPAAFPNLLANGSEGIAVGMATSIPPHNAGELCAALIHLLTHPEASVAELMQWVQGPDFPTGGTVIESKETLLKAYETGRGSFRIRARWEVEQLSHGMYQIVVTQIPYQVQKSKLIEKTADLFRAKKLALLGNIRDESTEDIRLILEPKSRAVDPEMLMESLFKLTDLESRVTLNLNVLTAGLVPRVLSLKETLQAFIDHRYEVLQRRSHYRLQKIAHRMEILEGYLIAYLNLDEVIRIIREEDEPKPTLMQRFNLSDVQAEAILNMRLRSLRKLEEMEIRGEHGKLAGEKAGLEALLADPALQTQALAGEFADIRTRFGEETTLGKRRTLFSEASPPKEIAVEAFVEKEPITILCSKMGWMRALKGHQVVQDDVKYKDGDSEGFVLTGQTTDKLLMITTDGKCYTVPCDRIPRGKGFGEPVRLIAEMDAKAELVTLLIYRPEAKLLFANSEGKGFLVLSEDVLAQTRQGRQVAVVPESAKLLLCRYVEGDMLAVMGDNRKLLVFPMEEIPVMKRGQGVQLQRYKAGGLADAIAFFKEAGLSWAIGGRTRTETDITPWLGKRGGMGRFPPTGFPRSNRFS